MKKGRFGYLVIPLVLLLSLVYYYLDDVLDHGHSWTYLNSYGQGLLTWGWNFEWFWGYLELGTIKACLIAAWFLYYSPPGAQMRIAPKKSPLTWALLILVVVAVIFSTSSPNSPIPYNTGNILLWGWDPAFAARHLLEILLFATGFWAIPILFFLRRRGAAIRRWNATTGTLFVVSAALTTHLILVGTWQAEDVLILENMVFGALGAILVILPVILANLAVFMKIPDQMQSREITGTKLGVKGQDLIFWAALLGGFFYIIFGVFWLSINTSLDFGSRWVPYNFWSWIYIALLSTFLIQIAWFRTSLSPGATSTSKPGGMVK